MPDLLSTLASAWDDVSRDTSRTRSAKRRIARAFATSPVLWLTNATGAPLSVSGLGAPRWLTFSDQEAADHYMGVRRGAAEALGLTAPFGWDAVTRTELGHVVIRQTSAPVLFNPSGPYGTLIYPDEAGGLSLARFTRTPTGAVDERVDLGARAQARGALRASLDTLRQAVRDGDVETWSRLWSTPPTLNPLADLEAASTAQWLSGVERHRRGDHEAGLTQAAVAAMAYERFGFPERCVEALLDLGPRLLEVAASGEPPVWALNHLRAVVVALKTLPVGNRLAEATRLAGHATELFSRRGDTPPGSDYS